MEQDAASPEASVFFRPYSTADEDEDDFVAVLGCCLAADTFALAHPPPLGTVCDSKIDGDLGEMMESFAYVICTERKRRYSAKVSSPLLLGKTDDRLNFIIVVYLRSVLFTRH